MPDNRARAGWVRLPLRNKSGPGFVLHHETGVPVQASDNVREADVMKMSKSLLRGSVPGAVCAVVILLAAGVPARAQGEKRTVFAPDDLHWQGSLKAGQTLEVVNTNGEIGADRASGDAARVDGMRGGGEDDHDLFIEVVE